jgi:hypothetical protein
MFRSRTADKILAAATMDPTTDGERLDAMIK